MLKDILLISSALCFSISSYAVKATEYVIATEQFNTVDASQCYYKTSSGAPTVQNFRGLLGNMVPEHYNGLTLQERGYVVDGWSPTWANCDNVYNSPHIVTYGNGVPIIDFFVIENPTWKGGVNRVNLVASASDYEGNIVSYEWIINGKVQTSTSSQITITTMMGGDYDIKVSATDGGVRIESTPRDFYYNAGYPTFEQTGTITRKIALQAWYCDGNCTIL